MLRHTLLLAAATLILSPLFVTAADTPLARAHAKLDRISDRKTQPGEVIVITSQELNAWAREQVPMAVPKGIRDPSAELGYDTATGSAVVDLLKIGETHGADPGYLLTKLLSGERPLKVSVRLVSGGGKCTVYLTGVELGGLSMQGSVLDFLVRNFFLPLYPDAKIGQPFELDDNIESLHVRPDGVRIAIKR